jgi:twitching motility protein PilT
MATVDALLRVLVENDGDVLRIDLGEPPKLLRGGAPLRYFFPTVDNSMHAALLEGLVTEERLATLAAGEPVQFTYEASGVGAFVVTLEGPKARSARFARSGTKAAAVVQAPEAPAAPREEAPAPVSTDAAALLGWLDHAAELGASDLHVATGQPPVMRIAGRLRPVSGAAVDVRALVTPLLTSDEIARIDAGRSVDKAVISPTGTRFRANVYRYDGGWAGAFRVLRRRAPTLASLGSPVPLDGLLDNGHGLVIVCGPTGSGKSTTLAALAQEALRRERGLLVTLEDPIEYTYRVDGPGALVRQREIGRDVADFPTGLRDSLREDPDLLLIGEMRDTDSIQLALTAAETGHLVLTSLHSRTATSAIERIVDAYPPERQGQIRVQLADALRAVVAQRLLPSVSGESRVLAVEVLRVTRAVAALIRDGKTAQLPSAIQTGGQDGMIPMERCLRDLVRAGRIEADVAKANTDA